MYNLKRGRGSYKGLIGECLFKLTRKYLIVTKFFNKNKYFYIFGDKLSEEEKDFIEKNWFSIDAIELDYTKNPRKVILFEIKTLNDYGENVLRKNIWLPKMTLATSDMYKEALKRGFDVKVAIIWLKDNWNYSIELTDFEKANYIIDKPKQYDKNKDSYFL